MHFWDISRFFEVWKYFDKGEYSLVQWNWFSAVTGCAWVHASSDVREPISLHQSVLAMHRLLSVNSLTNHSTLLCRNPVSITRSFLLTQTPNRCSIDKFAVSLALAHSCQAAVWFVQSRLVQSFVVISAATGTFWLIYFCLTLLHPCSPNPENRLAIFFNAVLLGRKDRKRGEERLQKEVTKVMYSFFVFFFFVVFAVFAWRTHHHLWSLKLSLKMRVSSNELFSTLKNSPPYWHCSLLRNVHMKLSF